MKPEIQQALNTIKSACASIQANLETHTVIQRSLELIERELGHPKELQDQPESD